MEIVSMGKKTTNVSQPSAPKSLTITPEALAFVQSKGKLEYQKVLTASCELATAMKGSVLFKDVADEFGEELLKFVNNRFAMLNPMMSKDFSPAAQGAAKGVQRKLFLDYAKEYNLEGIKEE